ncbi:MAG TPA: hypothetical protein VFU73_11680 [Actinocrinis sp.]|nr:hypothetical protein [Actinocrinis sp.]
MDRFAAHIVATAVLTVALAAIPTAMAQPASSSSATPSAPQTSNPTPTPTPTQTSASPAAPSASAAPSAPQKPAAPEYKHDERRRHQIVPPPNCPDAFQVGPTEYARWHGAVAFSVKQFYSPHCHARFGYAHPWLSFRAAQVNFDLGMADFDLTHDAIDGARTFVAGAGGLDFWSDPVVVPAGTCTQGLAHVFFPDDETDTFTSTYCL